MHHLIGLQNQIIFVQGKYDLIMYRNPSTEQRQVFERIFSSNYQTFFNIGFNICKNRDFSKDIVQSFFVELWESEIWNKEIEDLNAYLFRSFYRKAIREYKTAKRRQEFRLPPNLDMPVPSFEDLWIEIQEQESLQRHVKQAWEVLPEKQKLALGLRFREGMGYEEIAKKTGKSRQTIYNQIHSAIKKMKEIISTSPSS